MTDQKKRLDALSYVAATAIARKLAADEPLQQIRDLTPNTQDQKEPTREELRHHDRQNRLYRRTREHGGNRAARRNWRRPS